MIFIFGKHRKYSPVLIDGHFNTTLKEGIPPCSVRVKNSLVGVEKQ